MQGTSVFVLLAMVILASSMPLSDNLSIILGNEMDPINAMDWKTIDALIDNQKRILANKKVVVDGQEVNKDYAFNLIRHLSAIAWKHVHGMLLNRKEMVENEVAGRGEDSAILAEALEHTKRLKEVDWKIYLRNFGIVFMKTAVGKSIAQSTLSIPPTQLYDFGPKMSAIQEQTLKTTQELVRLNTMK